MKTTPYFTFSAFFIFIKPIRMKTKLSHGAMLIETQALHNFLPSIALSNFLPSF